MPTSCCVDCSNPPHLHRAILRAGYTGNPGPGPRNAAGQGWVVAVGDRLTGQLAGGPLTGQRSVVPSVGRALQDWCKYQYALAMSQGGARKRLEPKMTRGGFRFMITMAAIVAALQLVVLVTRLSLPWEDGNYLFIAVFLASVGFMARLVYVRHHDSVLWDEEEAER